MTGVKKVAKQAATEFLIHVTFQQFLVVKVPGNKTNQLLHQHHNLSTAPRPYAV